MTHPEAKPQGEPEAEETSAEEMPGNASDVRIAALEEELLQTKDRLMRALAEGENTRKRALKERDDAGKYAVSSFAKDLLDFSDNFSRALGAIPEDLKGVDPRLSNVMEGLSAMEREILKVFDRHGIQKIEPLDEIFDPNFHEVMFEAPMPGKAGGTIIQVIEPGYVLSGRLLRAAKVGVAQGDSGANGPGQPGGHVDQEA